MACFFFLKSKLDSLRKNMYNQKGGAKHIEIIEMKTSSVRLFSAIFFFCSCDCLSYQDTTVLFTSSSKKVSRSLLCEMMSGYLRK